MKSTEIYWTTLVSTAINSENIIAEYLCCPYSGCDCPAGQNFCSHMLAVVYLLLIIQENTTMNFEEIFDTLPKPVLDLQSIAIPMSFIY